MTLTLTTETPPLHEDTSGAIRVGQSRVLLELVIGEFLDGATPEIIVQRYPTAKLGDVYAVIGYYLRHPGEIDAYIQSRAEKSEDVRNRVESGLRDIAELRRRLNAKRSK